MFKYFALFALIAVAAGAAISEEAHAEVKTLKADVRADGFESALETTNGIVQIASGDVHGNIKGSYEYVSPKGVHVKVTYVADENGYQPSSDLLPTPPPVPAAILKSIEYIRAHAPADTKNYKN